jgi:hypothetical protein
MQRFASRCTSSGQLDSQIRQVKDKGNRWRHALRSLMRALMTQNQGFVVLNLKNPLGVLSEKLCDNHWITERPSVKVKCTVRTFLPALGRGYVLFAEQAEKFAGELLTKDNIGIANWTIIYWRSAADDAFDPYVTERIRNWRGRCTCCHHRQDDRHCDCSHDCTACRETVPKWRNGDVALKPCRPSKVMDTARRLSIAFDLIFGLLFSIS